MKNLSLFFFIITKNPTSQLSIFKYYMYCKVRLGQHNARGKRIDNAKWMSHGLMVQRQIYLIKWKDTVLLKAALKDFQPAACIVLDEEEQPSCCFSAVTIAAHDVLDVLARYNSSCNKNVRMSLSDITPSNSLLGLVTTSLCICVTKKTKQL